MELELLNAQQLRDTFHDDIVCEFSDTETVDHDYNQAVRKRISKPWVYETQYPMEQQPDINYRRTILTDQVNREDILKDPNTPFQARCVKYQAQNLQMQTGLNLLYLQWTQAMQEAAQRSKNKAQEMFFKELRETVVTDDNEDVAVKRELWQEVDELRRQRIAKELGIPANHENWTVKDKLRYWST